MALSGSCQTSAYTNQNCRMVFKWSATQNVSGNYSTISWQVVGSLDWGYVVVSELSVTINGSQVCYHSTADHTEVRDGTVKASGTTTIYHDSDGTKTLSVSIGAGIYNWAINCYGSGTWTLNTIARASSISYAGSITLGNSCDVRWYPSATSFRYKLKFSLGNWSYTTDVIHPNTTSYYTYTGYTIPLTVANQLTSATSGTMTVYLYSYSNAAGTTQIGSTASKTFTVTVPSTIVPSVSSVTAEIVNTNSVINGWGLAVAGYTKVKVSASASGSYGSTISSFTIAGGYSVTVNTSSLSYTGGVISSSGSKTFRVTAKDSRARTSSSVTSDAIIFYAYSKPSVTTLTASRKTNDLTTVVVRANWSYSTVNNKNETTATLYYKKSTASSWTTYGTIAKNTSVTLSNVTFDEMSSYNFRVIVRDSLSNTAQDEVFLSTISVLMDFRAGGKGLGIGKIAESDNLEIALDAIFTAAIKIRDGSQDITLKKYIQDVVNEMLAT